MFKRLLIYALITSVGLEGLMFAMFMGSQLELDHFIALAASKSEIHSWPCCGPFWNSRDHAEAGFQKALLGMSKRAELIWNTWSSHTISIEIIEKTDASHGKAYLVRWRRSHSQFSHMVQFSEFVDALKFEELLSRGYVGKTSHGPGVLAFLESRFQKLTDF